MLSSVYGKTSMKVLCIGHGGGSLPLFLACKIPGCIFKYYINYWNDNILRTVVYLAFRCTLTITNFL
ncbi:hypothetical protein Hanom_Chr14g01269061 [Helianthus anomalus]